MDLMFSSAISQSLPSITRRISLETHFNHSTFGKTTQKNMEEVGIEPTAFSTCICE
jgi:hypothetical protein